jgi:hypothetical protein
MSGPGGQWRDQEAKRAYMREWSRENRARLRAGRAERMRVWRARKARQAVAIDEFLRAFEGFEYARRCADMRREGNGGYESVSRHDCL